MERRTVLFSEAFAGLAWTFHVNPGSCDNPAHYEDYIRFYALSDKACGRGVTYAIVNYDDKDRPLAIAGYVTLRATSIVNVGDGTPRGESALEITELAVHENDERHRVGTLLVMIALTKAEELNESHIGIRYVVLCADPKAQGFYARDEFGFKKITDYRQLPRDGWNDNCVPMFLKIAAE